MTSTGALREPPIRLAYNIKAFVIDNALATPGTFARAGEDHDRQILSFLKNVKEVLGIVQHTVREAEPLSAKLNGAVYPVKNPAGILVGVAAFRIDDIVDIVPAADRTGRNQASVLWR